MQISHDLFHVTAVLNEISIAALFLHIVKLKQWSTLVQPLTQSKAQTVEVQSLLTSAKSLGKNYENAVKQAIKNDINWLERLPWLTILLTVFAMILTGLDFAEPGFELGWLTFTPFGYKAVLVLLLSLSVFFAHCIVCTPMRRPKTH